MKKLVKSFIGLSVLAFATPAWALEGGNPALSNRFTLGVGGFYVDTDATIGAETNQGGLRVSLNADQLGISGSETTPTAFALWRITNRLRLEFDYINVERDGQASVDKIDLGSIVIPVDLDIQSTLNTRFITARLGYSLVKNDTTEFGLSLGVSAARIQADAEGSIEGVGSARGEIDEEVPLPTAGIYATIALNDRFSIAGRAGILSLDIGDISGDLNDLFGGLDFAVTRNLGIGIGYRYVAIDVEVEETDYKQIYDITQSGPVAYLSLGF